MNALDQMRADAVAKERLLPFVMIVFAFLHPSEPPLKATWFLKAMCWWIERIARGELLRSMIWIMPRQLKSITAAVAFPCWMLGRNPAARIMIVTYADDLSVQHGEQRKQILESSWYRRLFPATRIQVSRQHEMKTTEHGHVLAVSVLGTITGRGADIIIIDDSSRAGDQVSEAKRESLKNWFTNTLVTRLNNKRTGAILSIQQRLHEDDLCALMLDRGYACLRLPAVADRDVEVEIGPKQTYLFKRGELLDPDRHHQGELDRLRIDMGPQNYSAQYLQEPTVPEGNLLRIEHFRRFEKPLRASEYRKVIQSWDTAASMDPKADWSVCTTWGWLAGRLFLLDIFRARVDFPTLRNSVIALEAKWRPHHVLIEHTSSGIGLIQELRRTASFKPIACRPSTGKAERVIAQTGQIEEGRVWLPAQLTGLDPFLSELRAFPSGHHDDQVDSMIQVLEFINERWGLMEQERTPSGRVMRSLRGQRPPLPLLPDCIK